MKGTQGLTQRREGAKARIYWIFLVLGVGGCGEKSASATTPESKAPATGAPATAAPTSAAPASIDPAKAPADARTSVEFAKVWTDILLIEDEEERLKQGDILGPKWQGRRYTWSGLALASLCFETRNNCALQVFTADLPERARLGGSLPLVTFRAGEWTKIKAACGAKEQCVVRFEAALIEARTDPDQALRLVFVDGQILEARPPVAGEPWFRPPAIAPATATALAKPTEKPAPLLTLPTKVF